MLLENALDFSYSSINEFGFCSIQDSQVTIYHHLMFSHSVNMVFYFLFCELIHHLLIKNYPAHPSLSRLRY